MKGAEKFVGYLLDEGMVGNTGPGRNTAFASKKPNQPQQAKKTSKPKQPKKPKRVTKKDLDKHTIDWWNSHSAKSQKEWVQTFPKAKVAQLVNQGILQYGEKVGGGVSGTQDQGAGKTGKKEYSPDSYAKINKEAIASTVEFKNLPPEHKKMIMDIAGESAKVALKQLKELKKKEKEDEITKDAPKMKGTPASKPVIINGKNKTLRKVNSSKTESWTSENSYKTKDIIAKNKSYKGQDISADGIYKMPDFIKNNPKFPKKYAEVLESMMNTRTADKGGFEPPISYFIKGSGGAGRINAQAGELLTMMGTAMSDDDFKEFKKSMLDHIEKNREKGDDKYVVTKDWIKAAENNRTAIHNRIRKEYGVKDASSMIVNTCWDTKEEVEDMGLTDYEKNKGYSSDIYIKVKDKKGNEFLNEVSLKKDKNVNFLNSGTGKLRDWDKKLPKDADMNVYASAQKDMLTKIDKKKAERILAQSMTPEIKEVHALLEKKKLSLDDALQGTNRDRKKILKALHTALAAQGDKNSIKVLEDLKTHEKKYQEAVIRELSRNPKVKDKMMDEIRGEFPLKSVLEKEETMAIGDMSVDKDVLKEIFKTDKWDDIKENLKSYPGPPPYIGYEASTKKEVIPLAEIAIREDGTGYGGTWKFEMKLHKEFAKRLAQANGEVYSELKGESKVISLDLRKYLTDTDNYILEKYRMR